MVGWYGIGVNNILQRHIRVQGMTCSCGHLATAIYFNLLKVVDCTLLHFHFGALLYSLQMSYNLNEVYIIYIIYIIFMSSCPACCHSGYNIHIIIVTYSLCGVYIAILYGNICMPIGITLV